MKNPETTITHRLVIIIYPNELVQRASVVKTSNTGYIKNHDNPTRNTKAVTDVLLLHCNVYIYIFPQYIFIITRRQRDIINRHAPVCAGTFGSAPLPLSFFIQADI